MLNFMEILLHQNYRRMHPKYNMVIISQRSCMIKIIMKLVWCQSKRRELFWMGYLTCHRINTILFRLSVRMWRNYWYIFGDLYLSWKWNGQPGHCGTEPLLQEGRDLLPVASVLKAYLPDSNVNHVESRPYLLSELRGHVTSLTLALWISQR